MPDVLIVGGGIIGAACAYELARRGATVTLLEGEELAAGASGRNLGLVSLPMDPVLDPLARASIQMYLEAVDGAPVPVPLDREPIGTLSVALDAEEAAMVREEVELARAAGIEVDHFEGSALRDLEPELTPDVADAWLLHDGRRVDPGALTVCLADLARSHGARIRHHLPVRRLVERGDRVSAVATDEGLLEADEVLLATGPWSASLLRPLGIALPITGARGWLVQFAPGRPLISRWIEGAARTIWRQAVRPTLGAEFAEGVGRIDAGAVLQPSPDGTVVAGTSREHAVAADPENFDVARAVAREAIRLVPALAGAPVTGTWSGIRPMSPDEKPLIGRLRPGLLVATGHGSEGVILGGGTAAVVASIVLDEPSPMDPAPFDPLRFA